MNSSKENQCPKESLTPKWKEDFPVDVDQDAHIARRDFIRFLFLVSLGLFTGTLGTFWKGLFRSDRKIKPFRILGKEDVEVEGSYVFQLPDAKGPAILVRLGTDEFVAYSQKCTHLQCPVIWRSKESKLYCPCHHGAFNVKTGDVLYGPPDRALPRIHLDFRPDGIYFKSMDPGL
ncbi:MAG: Rieske (2Fe-2S) protein [Desulfobacterales bacterium]|nr:Rieske (2Fe-2S) protein [Desulfobacterales bacterium]